MIGFVVFFTYGSFAEFGLHRYLQHRPLGWELYRTHTLIHHRPFRADSTYRRQRPEDLPAGVFTWWPGLILLGLHVPIVWGIQAATGLPVFVAGMTALAAYDVLYEILHGCMHDQPRCRNWPGGQWIEKTRTFRWLDALHRIHHRDPLRNLNVVFPAADFVLGTHQPVPAS